VTAGEFLGCYRYLAGFNRNQGGRTTHHSTSLQSLQREPSVSHDSPSESLESESQAGGHESAD
jgi:hypothetical protein